jgi:ABC-type oligopeptide transport system ATPase subunit
VTDVPLEVRQLKKHFPVTRGFLKRVVGWLKAVDGVNFSVAPGEIFGLVGESGSSGAHHAVTTGDPSAPRRGHRGGRVGTPPLTALSARVQRRLALARTLVLNPRLIIFDEPTAGLDVSVQATILRFFRQVQRQFDLTYVFICMT